MQAQLDPQRALGSLTEVSLKLAQDLDMGRILVMIVEEAMALTQARYGAVLTLSVDGRVEDFIHRGFTPQQVESIPHLPTGKGLLGAVLERRRPLRVERMSDHPAFAGFPPNYVPMEAFLGAPLLHGDQLIGAVYLTKPPEMAPFTHEHEHMVRVLCSMAAVGIENSRLLNAESQRAERGALLRAIATRVRRSLDTAEVLQATVQALGRAANVDRCFVRLVEAADADVEWKLGPIEFEWDAPGVPSLKEDPEVQFPVTMLAAMTRSTQKSGDVTRDRRLTDQVAGDLSSVGITAALATPLEWGDELLGVVTFHSTDPRTWTPSDVALIEAAAREVAIAIDHARRYQDALATAEGLRELDHMRSDFVSMVSHELRSPMTVVAGIADILEKRHDRLSPAQRTELFETLGRESRRLRRLVSEVLDLEAIDRGRLDLTQSTVDLLRLVREAVADAVGSERTHVSSDVDQASVRVDPDRIKQVLLNLISNAAKFSGDDSPIAVRVSADDRRYVIGVNDQGPGIPQEMRAGLFQRFSRLAPETSKPGSGLGLYLSKQIVDQHGGDIWVESEPGESTTFYFSIPR